MPRFIQIGNLPDEIDSAGLRQMFERHGGVRSAAIGTHHDSGRSTGVGCVEMESNVGGEAAIVALNHKEVYGRQILVCWSNSLRPWMQRKSEI